MAIPSFIKDPQAVLDFNWDWSGWRGANESIVSQTVVAAAEITVESSSIVGKAVAAWISGGYVNTSHVIACTITTSAGRTETRRIQISVSLR